MLRTALLGALVFGFTAAVAGYLWVALEFPFAILLPAALGWFAVVAPHYGARRAVGVSLVGGITFTFVFLVAVFFALADGSPFALTSWMAAALAAALAGAATGWLLGRGRGAGALAGFAGVGMLVASALAGGIRAVAPSTVDAPGAAQNVYVAILLLVVGAVVGGFVGAGVARLNTR